MQLFISERSVLFLKALTAQITIGYQIASHLLTALELWFSGAVLVHDPPCALTLGGTSLVKHEGLLHADDMLLPLVTLGFDHPVLASGLPVPSLRGPVGPAPVGVLPILGREEEPLRVIRTDQRFICTTRKQPHQEMESFLSAFDAWIKINKTASNQIASRKRQDGIKEEKRFLAEFEGIASNKHREKTVLCQGNKAPVIPTQRHRNQLVN